MLLAVDTSTKTVGVALYQEDRVVGEMLWQSNSYHTTELAPAVQTLLQRSETQPGSLKALGVALGPGSFTGLRIGLAFVKGLAQGLNLHVVGIPTLDFLAAAQPPSDLPLVAVLQAGRGRLAVGRYRLLAGCWQLQDGYTVMTAEELVQTIRQPTLVCGELNPEERKTLARKYRNAILASPARSVRRPSFLAELAWQRWQKGETGNAAALSPIYLHTGDEIPQ